MIPSSDGAPAQRAEVKHVASRYAADTMASAALLRQVDTESTVAIIPDAVVVKVGAQSLIDRGRSAVYPVVEELGANCREHKLIIGVGASTRARHVYDLCSDLGLPAGLLAILGAGISEQNALMISALMGKYSAIRVPKEQFGRRSIAQGRLGSINGVQTPKLAPLGSVESRRESAPVGPCGTKWGPSNAVH